MADLREVFAKLGHTDVVTDIQSGNVVFDAAAGSVDSLPRQIEAGIADESGFDVPVVIRTPTELVAIIESSPYVESEADPAVWPWRSSASHRPPIERQRSTRAPTFRMNLRSPGERSTCLSVGVRTNQTHPRLPGEEARRHRHDPQLENGHQTRHPCGR